MYDARIEENANRFAHMLRRGLHQDPALAQRPVPGMEWNVGQLVAHVYGITDLYAQLTQAAEPTPFPDDFDAWSNERVSDVDGIDLAAVADQMRFRAASLVDELGDDADRLVNFWGGQQPVYVVTGTWLSELVMHSYDLSEAIGAHYRVEAPDARRALDALLQFGLDYTNDEVVANNTGTVCLKIRGGRTYRFDFDGRVVTMARAAASSPDWTISADPSALLMVAWGRENPAKAALTGKVIGWGRNPALGLAFPKLMESR